MPWLASVMDLRFRFPGFKPILQPGERPASWMFGTLFEVCSVKVLGFAVVGRGGLGLRE